MPCHARISRSLGPIEHEIALFCSKQELSTWRPRTFYVVHIYLQLYAHRKMGGKSNHHPCVPIGRSAGTIQITKISSVFDRRITGDLGRCNADDRRQSTRLPLHYKPYAGKIAAAFCACLRARHTNLGRRAYTSSPRRTQGLQGLPILF